jgi:hypothetical protein
MKLKAVLAMLGLISAVGIPSAALAASGAGAILLAFPIGARYNALGEAGVGLAQDVSAAWFNPGGLAFLPDWNARTDVQIMHSGVATGLATDMGLYSVGAAFAGSGRGVLAGSFTFLDMGSQDAVDENGNITAKFSSNEFVAQVNYAFKLSPTLGLGFGTKYFRDNLAPGWALKDYGGGGSGWAYAFDFGLLQKFPGPRLNLGLAVMNVGPKRITHVDEQQSDPMPSRAAAGFGWQPYQSEFLGLVIAADYQLPLYKYKGNGYVTGLDPSQEEWGCGVEAAYDRSFFLRFGRKAANYGDINDWTYGFGVDLLKWTSTPIRFDFASVPQAKSLDSVKRFSLGYRF